MSRFLDFDYYRKKKRRYWSRLYWEKKYDLAGVRAAENRKFEAAGFSRDSALTLLNRVLEELGKPAFGSKSGIGSIHWLLFCALRQTATIRRILEIGTYDGETTLLLSKIFPEADIVTIDLPDDDPILRGSYHREDPTVFRQFKQNQERNLRSEKIEFIRQNSFFLPSLVEGKFDLIWIDGGHLYPEISWDVCNAYHLCEPGGWILCDDVMLDAEGYRDGYVSPDSFAVLEYVRQRTGEDVTYFLKRDAPKSSADPRKRKHVAGLRRAGAESDS